MTNPHPADTEVLPADQRRAAELAEACVRGNGERLGDLLAELVDAGPERALAVTAVLARNLATVMVAEFGIKNAVKLCEATRLDAALAEPTATEPDPDTL